MKPVPTSSHLLVTLQFACIALGLIPFGNSPASPGWLALSVIGIAVGLYTLLHNRFGNFGIYPEPLDNAQLITSGPYRWVRHPMYLSLLLFMLGAALYNNGLINQLSLLGLVIALIGKMNKEEAYLRQQFDAYADYCSRSKRLIPYLY